MKILIKKEIRLLLPAWITAMVLAIVPRVFILFGYPDLSVPLSFYANLIVAAGLLFLGINSFGEEMSSNTFSALLSQPMKRPRIWRIKIVTLAVAFISVWLTAILFASLQFGAYQPPRPDISFLTLSALVTFSGGLWTTLLLRQITGAFWFTLLTPLAIILAMNAAFQDWIDRGKSFNIFIETALVLYSIAGFVLAWRLFMRAQDLQWVGGEVSLPQRERASKITLSFLFARPGHRFSSLVWKELQLHQGAFLIAAIILALHIAACFIRKYHPHILNPNIAFAQETIWILWLLMPLLIGAAAIAEERRMGTLEPQLCLPVSRGTQLFVKFCIALVLSLFFGALMPVLIEGTKALDQWLWIFIAAAAIFCTSFYTSSLGRTTLQSIGWAILVALLIYTEILRISYFANPEVERLTQYLGGAILPIVLGWLTFTNFKHEHQNWKLWIRNSLAVLVVFGCVPVLAAVICFLRELLHREVL